MPAANRTIQAEDLLDVREAAAHVGRNPETVRRWVWSGRLAARRSGHRLLVARSDLDAITGQRGMVPTLAQWADRVRAVHGQGRMKRNGPSAANLVIRDRERRSDGESHAGR